MRCSSCSDSQRVRSRRLRSRRALRRGALVAVSRASIYRILDELERLSLLKRVETGQAMVRYERSRSGASTIIISCATPAAS